MLIGSFSPIQSPFFLDHPFSPSQPATSAVVSSRSPWRGCRGVTVGRARQRAGLASIQRGSRAEDGQITLLCGPRPPSGSCAEMITQSSRQTSLPARPRVTASTSTIRSVCLATRHGAAAWWDELKAILELRFRSKLGAALPGTVWSRN